jgi:hypothetical protein
VQDRARRRGEGEQERNGTDEPGQPDHDHGDSSPAAGGLARGLAFLDRRGAAFRQ